MSHFDPSCRRRKQTGAALATALFFLVVITLLGLAAMRSGTMGLRLALNEESRVNALESAQSLLEALLADADNLLIEPGSDYVQNCFVAPALQAAVLAANQAFECPTGTPPPVLPPGALQAHAYTLIRRESIGEQDFAPVSALRRGDSGERYRLASFTVTAGFDRTPASRAAGAEEIGGYGAAEISQGTYVKVDSIDGLVVQ